MLPHFTDHYITLKGLRLRYWRAGENGSPVILLHGLLGSVENWRYTIGPLAETHRVFAFDGPGHGLSEWHKRAQSLQFMREMVAEFMQAHGVSQAALVGHSGGGLAALSTALELPQLVSKLILANSAGLGFRIASRLRMASTLPGMLVPVAPPQNPQALRFIMENYMFYEPRRLSDAIFDDVSANLARAGTLQHACELVRWGVNIFGQKLVFTRRLSQLRVPTLVIWGQQDLTLPVEHGERAARLIPGAKFVSMDHCRHLPMLERPEEFNELLLEFLAEAREVVKV